MKKTTKLMSLLATLTLMLSQIAAIAAPTVANVTTRQRFPWNGLVDIDCNVSGIDETDEKIYFSVQAEVPGSGEVHEASHLQVVRSGTNSTDLEVKADGAYRLVWDAKADLGAIKCDDLNVCVALIYPHKKIQLWAAGPYWATTNIGAENPEDYGYYFWWGDIVGYRRENTKWVATDGSSLNFSFVSSKTPTYNKSISDL